LNSGPHAGTVPLEPWPLPFFACYFSGKVSWFLPGQWSSYLCFPRRLDYKCETPCPCLAFLLRWDLDNFFAWGRPWTVILLITSKVVGITDVIFRHPA
jgi:hypothetical protein